MTITSVVIARRDEQSGLPVPVNATQSAIAGLSGGQLSFTYNSVLEFNGALVDTDNRLPVDIGTSVALTGGTFTLDTTDSNNIAATAAALGTPADAAWISGSGTVISLLKNIIAKLAGSIAVTGTFWQSIQPVSGTVTANLGTVDTANLASINTATTASAVSLTTLGAQTDTAWVSGSGSVIALLKTIVSKLAGSIAVTGTFWQATQPVSGTFWQTTQPVSGSVTANLDSTNTGSLGAIVVATEESANSLAALGTLSDTAWVSGDGSVVAILKAISSTLLNALTVAFNASTTGGVSTHAFIGGTGNALLAGTPVTVKSGATSLYGSFFQNPNNVDIYIQVFDLVLAGSVDLGVTVPKMVLYVPANKGIYNEKFPSDARIAFLNGMVMVATTTPTGAIAPSSGIFGTVYLK